MFLMCKSSSGGILMKKYTFFFICCSVLFFSAITAFAQVGFTGPQGFTGQPGITGQYGYTGQVQTVTVAQAQAFAHRTTVTVTGTIVQAIGGDNYIFRDSSGEIILKIGPREWMNFGSTIGPSDTIEISGEVHRDQRNWQRPAEIHARYIRKL
jgi:uncharacterized protein (TIGR00156 family)